MKIHRAGHRRPLAAILAAAALAAGCGGDPDRARAVPASGTVTYQGKPLEFGFVQFVPEQGRPASGQIEPDGRFTLTTYDRTGDGAIPGRHHVGVIVTEPIPGSAADEDEEQVRYIVPRRFAGAMTSGIVVEIPPEGKTDLAIAID